VALLSWTGAELEHLAATPQAVALDARALGVARWAVEHGELSGLGTETLPGAEVACAPLRATQGVLGVLVLWPRAKAPLSGEQRTSLDLFVRQLSTALERARFSGEARAAALRARTEELRASLLSAVSHDLRTPLASITGAATSLRDDAKLGDATRAELVESIVDEAGRLERLVANLLDMTRLDAGAVTLKREWVPLDELIGGALTRLEPRLDARAVSVTLAPGLPLLSVDPVLIEQLFVNLLENADKYTPPGSPLELNATSDGLRVTVSLADHGPGLAPGTEQRIFEKFFRGAQTRAGGAGLGLAICRGIVDAHGGTISAENREGGGAVFRVVLPIGGSPPVVLPVSEPAP
jgi:two-component system sensor histidine kinase KdpD